MQKRGQVTLFVVLGILVLIIILILVFLMRVRVESSTDISQNIDISQTKLEADNIIQVCLSDVSERAVIDAGEFGGYALQKGFGRVGFCKSYDDVTRSMLKIQAGRTGYYTYYVIEEGTRSVPGFDFTTPINPFIDTSKSEECLEDYIITETTECINGFSQLINKGWNPIAISNNCRTCDYRSDIGIRGEQNIGINVEIAESIQVEYDIPREFSRDNSVFQVGRYTHTVDFNFKFIFEQLNAAINLCESEVTSIADITNAIKDEISNKGYELISSASPSDIFEPRKQYHFIIKKGVYRFKFGLACI